MDLIASYDTTLVLPLARRMLDQATTSLTIEPTLADEFLQHVYQCTGNYLRSNRDFSSLAAEDRSAVIRNTAENVTCLGTLSIWHQGQLIDCPTFLQIYTNRFGTGSVELLRTILNRLDRDVDLMKLSISLFAFSNHSSIFSSTRPFDTANLHRIQSSYAELIWKYLRSKYSDEESVQRWINLLQCFLNATKVIAEYQFIRRHVDQIESIVEETELNLVLADFDGNE